MPDHLIRNVPAALHASLKAPTPPLLPELIKMAGPPLTNRQLLAMINDGLESRGMPDSSPPRHHNHSLVPGPIFEVRLGR